jgi:hypothetical protein
VLVCNPSSQRQSVHVVLLLIEQKYPWITP